MGKLRSSDTVNTSASRWVRSRWALSWCMLKSALLTKILAINQSYSESVGKKMGLSSAGVCFSCRRRKEDEVQSVLLTHHKDWLIINKYFLYVWLFTADLFCCADYSLFPIHIFSNSCVSGIYNWLDSCLKNKHKNKSNHHRFHDGFWLKHIYFLPTVIKKTIYL